MATELPLQQNVPLSVSSLQMVFTAWASCLSNPSPTSCWRCSNHPCRTVESAFGLAFDGKDEWNKLSKSDTLCSREHLRCSSFRTAKVLVGGRTFYMVNSLGKMLMLTLTLIRCHVNMNASCHTPPPAPKTIRNQSETNSHVGRCLTSEMTRKQGPAQKKAAVHS